MDADELIHRVTWTPADLCREPLRFGKVVFLAYHQKQDDHLSSYCQQLTDGGWTTVIVRDETEIDELLSPDTIFVHTPYPARGKDVVYEAVIRSCASLIATAKRLRQHYQSQPGMKKAIQLFSLITEDFGVGGLASAPLYGLARVLQREIPDVFGGLFVEYQGHFPISAIKHAQGFDVVKVIDGIPHTASLQHFEGESMGETQLRLDPDSTYLITGGTRGMGLEFSFWMCERGARNILLVSRHGLGGAEPRNADTQRLVSAVANLEARGVTAHVLAVDLSQPKADLILRQAIEDLHIPPVKGVIHGAGVAGYHTLERCPPSEMAEILAPKVIGAMHLDAVFPPGTLEFFVLASSIGQLVGFTGQLSYAPANSFLDGLAAQRRRKGDNSTSIQWGSWRGVGLMAQSKSATRMITREMEAVGIAAISKEEALRAFERILCLGSDHAAVVRVLAIKPNVPPRHPMLKDITPRRNAPGNNITTSYSSYPEHAVAVISMACRTAAGDSADDLWQAVRAGQSMARTIDTKRFTDAVGKDRLWGNFLSNIESFDHRFFKVSKREAAALDPHQRVLLEVAYEAIETAGWLSKTERKGPEGSQKTTTGCFIGMTAPDYPINLACHNSSPYTALGMTRAFVSGRLSHYFGWTGPSQVIDTACSSSMVAIHQACRALQTGECTRAVAGGINLITNTAFFEALRAGGFLSSTGASKTFDARADGYCRGEAAGVVVLKPLTAALKDGDHIDGVLLATASNQNLNSTTITNPVQESQTVLCQAALACAGIRPWDVSYVEAHGTGTRSGDPIEVEAIRQALGGKDRPDILHIGSVKPCIGHTEGASGVVSLIKLLLMLKHGQIPPQAQYQTLNPEIPALEPDNLAISTTLQKWCDNQRLAVVNNAGASGSNAVAIVAPPPPTSLPVRQSQMPPAPLSAWPIFISAASEASLAAYCGQLKDWISNPTYAPKLGQDLAYALATKQNRRLQHKFCTTATSVNDLRIQLSDPKMHIKPDPSPKSIVLLFSGQNGNTVPSAKALYDNCLLFRAHLDRCEEVMMSLGFPSLLSPALYGIRHDADLVVRHATMFAIQYSSGMSWIDSGVIPLAICGHSLGEWAAMAVSGALSLEDGMRVVTGRAILIEKYWGDDTGAMLAIEVDTDTAPEKYLHAFHEKHPEAKVEIACYNGLSNYVMAGSTVAIELLGAYLKEAKSCGQKVRFKVLRDMHAYHSALVDSIVHPSSELSTSITLQDPLFPFESCHHGPWNSPGCNLVARNTRGPVYFMQTLSRIICDRGPCVFLEAGIGGPIIRMAQNALQHSQTQHTFVAISGRDPVRSLADAMVVLWRSGQSDVQFWAFHDSHRARYSPLALPSYQFERHRHWVEYSSALRGDKKVHDLPQADRCPHCLKDINDFPYIIEDGSQVRGSDEAIFKVDTRSKCYQDLTKGHTVTGLPVCPVSVYVELAAHALALLCGPQMISVATEIVAEALEVTTPLGLDTQASVSLKLVRKASYKWEFELSSAKVNRNSISHGTGIISLRDSANGDPNSQEGKVHWDRICSLLEGEDGTETLRGKIVYKVFQKVAKYSQPYQGVQHLAGKGIEGAGDIMMPSDDAGSVERSPNINIADPLLMESFLMVAGAFMYTLRGGDTDEDDDMTCICTGMGSVGPLNGPRGTGNYRVYAKIMWEDHKMTSMDIFSFNTEDKRMVWSAKGVKFAKVPRKSLSKVVERANSKMAPTVEPASPSKFSSPQKPDRRNEKSVDVLGGIREILSKSLDVAEEEITMQSLLEELGADSLVRPEILTGVCVRFKVHLSSEDFATATDIASLCGLVSSQISNSAADISSDSQAPSAVFAAANETSSEWEKTIFQILSQSLDLDMTEIQISSKLEDLGVDSLVTAEIIGNLNDAFSLNISPTTFSTMVDVASLCDLIAAALGISSRTSSNRSSSGSSSGSSSRAYSTQSILKENNLESLAGSKRMPQNKDNMERLHSAFRQTCRGFDAHAQGTRLTDFWDLVYPQQLSVVTAFIIESFQRIGCNLKDFKTGEKLPPLQGPQARWHREVQRLWEILEEAGVVDKRGGCFLRGPTLLDGEIYSQPARQLCSALISKFPQHASSHALLGLLGPHLAESLTGETDPVSLLFGTDRGRNLLEDCYASAPSVAAATGMVCEFVSAAIGSRASENEPFRILEIGGGTGGTTKRLVPILQATGLPFTYTFTDISASLIARAKRKTFKGVACMDFRRLNVEEEMPEELLGHFHVVLSANCVHATHNLRRSLSNIRKLVRFQDGCVLLVEGTQKQPWYDLVYGLLDGWWLFNDGRSYALQSPWAWERALQDAGFGHIDWSENTSRESRDVRIICGMAAQLETPCSAKATSMLLHRSSLLSEQRNLFLVPDGFGSGTVFNTLKPVLTDIQGLSVYALTSPFVKHRPDPHQHLSIEELASFYVAKIKRRQPEGPYVMGGYSIGGVVAFEAVRQLLENADEVEKLFLIDTPCPTRMGPLPNVLVGFLDSIDCTSIAEGDTLREKRRGRLISNNHFAMSMQQLKEYKMRNLPGRKIPLTVVISAKEGVDKQNKVPRPDTLPEDQAIVSWLLDDKPDDGPLGWDDVLECVKVVRANGNHFSMMMPPMVHEWGLELAHYLMLGRD